MPNVLASLVSNIYGGDKKINLMQNQALKFKNISMNKILSNQNYEEIF